MSSKSLFFARLALCGLSFPALAHAAAPHQYRVSIDAAMDRMTVEALFSFPVESVRAKSGDAGQFLIDVRDCDDLAPIRLRNQRMMLPHGGIRCMRYSVDFGAAAASLPHNRALAPGNVVVSPSLWLWRPALSGGQNIEIRFDLPGDMQVAVPWRQPGGDDRVFRLGASPESSNAPAVFGNFDYREIDVPGATLRVSVLREERDRDTNMDETAIIEWLRITANDVSLAYGRFPNPAPQVVVVPVDKRRKSDSAVPFGRVIRDGGEAIELFIDRDQPLDAFLGDWTATHEFSHLMLPYVAPAHRWVSEGFAQYYQNVLMARSGTYAPLTAWQELYDGLERGRQSRPELSPNEATARRLRDARMKIYWSGAAIALMADVALRERSAGAMTLDDVMGRLQACCLPSDRTWSGPELFERLDILAGTQLFMPLYRRYADTAGFPDARPLFARLGFVIADDGLRVRRSAELAEIRTAITRSGQGRPRDQLAAERRNVTSSGSAGSR